MKVRPFRILISLAVVALAIFFIYPKFREILPEVPFLFKEASPLLLGLAFVLQCLTLFFNALLARQCFLMINEKPSFLNLLKISPIADLGNQIVPFIGGPLANFYAYKNLNVSVGKSIVVASAWSIFVMAFALLFFLFNLFFVPNFISVLSPHFLYIIIPVILILGVLVYLLLKNNGSLLLKIVKRINASFYGKVEEGLKNFKEVVSIIKTQKEKIPLAFLWAGLFYLANIFALQVSFAVFGLKTSIFLVNFGYVIVSFFGFLIVSSQTPGVTEAFLAFIFTQLGIPVHVAVFGTLLYRIITYWLFLPLGLASFI
ncbi:MAG: flippase-like domain-containing protein, partial [Candidatus Pacebacteria bacterium]|nr:flippase-like domain-containing protein [Candidatus Paceibacterota bacterium]